MKPHFLIDKLVILTIVFLLSLIIYLRIDNRNNHKIIAEMTLEVTEKALPKQGLINEIEKNILIIRHHLSDTLSLVNHKPSEKIEEQIQEISKNNSQLLTEYNGLISDAIERSYYETLIQARSKYLSNLQKCDMWISTDKASPKNRYSNNPNYLLDRYRIALIDLKENLYSATSQSINALHRTSISAEKIETQLVITGVIFSVLMGIFLVLLLNKLKNNTDRLSKEVEERERVVVSLRKSEERLDGILNTINDAVWSASLPDFRTLFASAATKEVFGTTVSEFKENPKLWIKHVHPEDLPEVESNFAKFLEHGKFDLDHRYIRPDGELRWLRSRGWVIRDETGSPIRIDGCTVDITGKKKSEIALQASEERYRLMFDTNPHPMWVYDLDTLSFIAVNNAAIRHYGYSREEFMAMTLKDIRRKDEINALLDEINDSSDVLKTSGPWRHRKKDGSEIFVEVNSHAFVLNGKAARLVQITDITSRLEVERQAFLHSAALRAAGNAIAIFDTQKKIHCVNPEFCRITGYSEEELLGAIWGDLIFSTESDPIQKEISNALKKGKVWRGELENRRKNGERYDEEATITPVRNSSGNITHYIIIKQDITERKNIENELLKAKEKAEQSDKLKDSFIANLSHEIRTPLGIIMGYTSVLEEILDCDGSLERREIYESITRAGKRLMRSIELILNISHMQIGTYPLYVERLNAYEEINQLVKDFQIMANEKNLSLEYTGTRVDYCINGDQHMFTQVISNLLDNAIKFTERGAVHVDIESNENTVNISVRDTGIGISPEYIPHLFDKFSQEKNGYTRPYEGLGVGLALTKRFIDSMEGTISVESRQNEGTVFSVSFPTAKKDNNDLF